MKKLLLASVAALSLAAAAPAYAQNNDAKAAAGATAGGATGAVIGGLIGGPIGAIIGGFSGAAIGADAAVPDEVVAYAGNNPVDVVTVKGVEVGGAVTSSITVHPTDNPDYGYFYANNRIYIVDMKDSKIVSSPGYLVPQSTVAYVEANPSTAVTFSGDLSAGVALPADVQLTAIPDNPYYSYVYIGDRPVLVDNSTRTVIWTR